MASTLLLVLALLTFFVLLLSGAETWIGGRSIRFLRDIPPFRGPAMPHVSVVIAARNEERNIEQALRSVLRQGYPELEVIVVDDRSTDRTGVILDRLSEQNPRLRILHLRELPPGWLGKNHALERGAEGATGEILLFTDADVVMEPTTLARAVAFLEGERIDHLAAAPELWMPGTLLNVFGGTFSVFFAQYARPWKARDPASPYHIGVGAFNLIRASVYRAIGGHRPIAMRPDDDMKLGKLVKKHGFRQDVVFGRGMIGVEWYASLGEVVRGLEKNSFAGIGYSVLKLVASTVALLLVNVWPFLAVWVTEGWTRMLNLGIVALLVLFYAASTRGSGAKPWGGIGVPFATLFIVFIMWRSALLALLNRGIRWRDTHYPLEELRANRV